MEGGEVRLTANFDGLRKVNELPPDLQDKKDFKLPPLFPNRVNKSGNDYSSFNPGTRLNRPGSKYNTPLNKRKKFPSLSTRNSSYNRLSKKSYGANRNSYGANRYSYQRPIQSNRGGVLARKRNPPARNYRGGAGNRFNKFSSAANLRSGAKYRNNGYYVPRNKGTGLSRYRTGHTNSVASLRSRKSQPRSRI